MDDGVRQCAEGSPDELASKPPAPMGKHRAVRERLSELTVAIPIAITLVVLLIGGAYFVPHLVSASRKSAADPGLTALPTGPASSTAPSGTGTASGTASDSATPNASATATAESDSCTYEVLAGMDARLHKGDTTVAFPNDSSIGVLVAALETQFLAMLRTEPGQKAVADTFGLARQLCDSAGNPMLNVDGVRALMTVATQTDVKLLARIRALGAVGPEPTVPSASASSTH